MEKKINVAGMLQYCPKGMELDCILFNNPVKCVNIDNDDNYPITILTENNDYLYFTKEGYLYNMPNSKCLIFPKGKTTWEEFVPPCQFKDGDILVHTQNQRFIMSIYHKKITELIIKTHCILWDKDEGLSINMEICCYPDNTRLATEEEKQKLFQAIKDNGYNWNEETKTLEKLIVPKFKVGDTIKHKSGRGYPFTITEITNGCYKGGTRYAILITQQDNFELVPNKFDINTLVPFESKVLIRNDESQHWIPAFWGYKRNVEYVTTFGWCKYCIPFDGNENLLGTSGDCEEYYKTWE